MSAENEPWIVHRVTEQLRHRTGAAPDWRQGDRFSPEARQVLFLAEDRVARAGGDKLEPAHLVAVLLEHYSAVDLARISDGSATSVGLMEQGMAPLPAALPEVQVSTWLQKALAEAYNGARAQSSPIRLEHLMLGLLADEYGSGRNFLDGLGVDSRVLYRALHRAVYGSPAS